MISQNQIRDLRFADPTAASTRGRPGEVCFIESLNEHFYYKVDNALVDDGALVLAASGTDAHWVKVGATSGVTFTADTAVNAPYVWDCAVNPYLVLTNTSGSTTTVSPSNYVDGKEYVLEFRTTTAPASIAWDVTAVSGIGLAIPNAALTSNTSSKTFRFIGKASVLQLQVPGSDFYLGAGLTTAGIAGLVPPAAAGEEVKVLTGDGLWRDQGFNWLFADNTTLAPAIVGNPSTAEISTFCSNAGTPSRFVFFTGTDNSADTITRVFYVDVSMDAKLLWTDFQNPAPFLVATSIDIAPAQVDAPTDLEVQNWVLTNFPALSEAFVKYTGSGPSKVFVYRYYMGSVLSLEKPATAGGAISPATEWLPLTAVTENSYYTVFGYLCRSTTTRTTTGQFDATEAAFWAPVCLHHIHTQSIPDGSYVFNDTLYQFTPKHLFKKVGSNTLVVVIDTLTGNEWEKIAAANAVAEIHEQGAHGFLPGRAVYHNGTNWVLAQADLGTKVAQAVVTNVLSANLFEVTYMGMSTGYSHGLTPGQYYWLSQTTPGELTTVQPTSGIVQSVLHVQTSARYFVNIGTAISI